MIDGFDFYQTIVEDGEQILFQNEEQTVQYASIAPHRATNTTDGSYWYRGAMTFDSISQQERLIGEYFTRQTNPNPMHILTSVMPENTTERVAEVYAVECNDKISIVSHYEVSGKDKFGDDIYEPVYIAEDIDCYTTVTQRPLSEQIQGNQAAMTTNVLIPAKHTLSIQNAATKKGFAFNSQTKQNEYTDIKYKIESIDLSMMDIVDDKPVGIIRFTMTEDRNS